MPQKYRFYLHEIRLGLIFGWLLFTGGSGDRKSGIISKVIPLFVTYCVLTIAGGVGRGGVSL